MTRIELENKLKTIVRGYMADLNNPKTLAEVEDILITHFNMMATSAEPIDNNYFEEEFTLWSNR
jgi:hypothetical protein